MPFIQPSNVGRPPAAPPELPDRPQRRRDDIDHNPDDLDHNPDEDVPVEDPAPDPVEEPPEVNKPAKRVHSDRSRGTIY